MATNDNQPVKEDAPDAKRTGFGTTATKGDENLAENSKENLDEKLDNAVDETFPGSDPISLKITK